MFNDYESYEKTSENYDATRLPVGGDLLIKELNKRFNSKLSSLKLLDAGCGTGNYIKILRPNFDEVTGYDQCDEMLNVAKNKFDKSDKKVKFQIQCIVIPYFDQLITAVGVEVLFVNNHRQYLPIVPGKRFNQNTLWVVYFECSVATDYHTAIR